MIVTIENINPGRPFNFAHSISKNGWYGYYSGIIQYLLLEKKIINDIQYRVSARRWTKGGYQEERNCIYIDISEKLFTCISCENLIICCHQEKFVKDLI